MSFIVVGGSGQRGGSGQYAGIESGEIRAISLSSGGGGASGGLDASSGPFTGHPGGGGAVLTQAYGFRRRLS